MKRSFMECVPKSNLGTRANLGTRQRSAIPNGVGERGELITSASGRWNRRGLGRDELSRDIDYDAALNDHLAGVMVME
jgi:hypothetical protein